MLYVIINPFYDSPFEKSFAVSQINGDKIYLIVGKLFKKIEEVELQTVRTTYLVKYVGVNLW